jgi:phenylalanyl-tRNA synthetase beta chain
MKVTLNWLRQYVDFDWSPEELAARLTMLGLEVEGMHKVGGEFEGVVVAQILTRDKVPGSDKLSVCKVNDGTSERTIICGAQNHGPGDKVPLILPNFALPLKAGEKEPFVIKERKVFGITSQGMMCSPQELGLPDDVDGLLLLPKDAPVGKPFAEYLGRSGSDVVYDLEITPNRPDWNSVIGIAREIAALTGNALKIPAALDAKDAGGNASSSADALVSVRLEDTELCPRYTARVIRGVKVGPSPDWLRSALEKVGVRSISNVVDVTNYVMLEAGQPLHAFDYHLIAKGTAGKPTIVVRRGQAGEKFTTLDGQSRTLGPDNLLIADEQKAIALAGVMGGQDTEINDRTVDVLIESAYFQPANVRRTSKALGLRTESSYRFERGCDPNWGVDYASRRACQLILETAGGQLAEGVVDVYPNPVLPRTVTLRPEKVTQLLGVPISAEEIECYLAQLGLKVAQRKARPVEAEARPEPATFTIPTYRVDLKREVDLIEEVARLYGVDRIPGTAPRGAIGSNAFDPVYDEIAQARRLLSGLGLNEAQGQTLIAEASARLVTDAVVPLANPLSNDMNVLRPSLLPGLLDSLKHNVSRKNSDVALFEVGRVFLGGGANPSGKGARDSSTVAEERRVAIAITGRRSPPFWSGAAGDENFDVSDLKGMLEEFLEQFGLRGVTYAGNSKPGALYSESAAIALGGKLILGQMGRVSPVLARRYDLRDPVFVAELNLDQLLARRNAGRSFKALPQFPSIRRDIAMLVPEAITHDAVLNAARQAKPPHLDTVELFDVFRGKNIPEGRKSVAYAFTYRSPEKTLTDAEVNAAHERLVEHFKKVLDAAVRDS